jgi:hypothetical protein
MRCQRAGWKRVEPILGTATPAREYGEVRCKRERRGRTPLDTASRSGRRRQVASAYGAGHKRLSAISSAVQGLTDDTARLQRGQSPRCGKTPPEGLAFASRSGLLVASADRGLWHAGALRRSRRRSGLLMLSMARRPPRLDGALPKRCRSSSTGACARARTRSAVQRV